MFPIKFDIAKYCKKCPPVEYTKLATSGNNPHITKAMRYAEYVRNAKPRLATKTANA